MGELPVVPSGYPPANGGRTSTVEPGPTIGPPSRRVADSESTRKLHIGVTAFRAGNAAWMLSTTLSSVPGSTSSWSHPAAARAPAKNLTVT